MYTRRVFGGVAALSLAAYFLLLAGQGLTIGFTHDDLMNMYRAEELSTWGHLRATVLFFTFSEVYLPVGSLFYRVLFSEFGFHPLAYRVACYALMALNGWLAYLLARRLSGSYEVGLLTVLLFAFHGQLSPLYTNTGFIYDILCLTFYCAAMLVYVRAREGGRAAGWRAIAVWTVLFILCLNSKEMAVTLPVMIGLWEWLQPGPRDWRVAVWGCALTAVFIVGRIWLPGDMSANPQYATDLRAKVYLDHAEHFLWFVVYRAKWFTGWHAVAFVMFVCTAVIAWRDASLRWAAMWIPISVLPVAFIMQRSLAAAYLPYLALAFFLAQAVWKLTGNRAPFAAVFVCLLALLFHVHKKHSPMPVHLERGEHVETMEVARQLGAWRQELRCAKNILFVENPFPQFEWNSFFLASLLAMDPTVKTPACEGETPSYTEPDRVRIPKRLRERYQPGDVVPFALVLTYENGEIRECGGESREWRWAE
ncbi:MAG: glycosyltransferase family 39 protein [Acidobacteriota bacterium]